MRITITLDESLYGLLVDQADREDRPMARIVREVLSRHYRQHPAGRSLEIVP